MRLSFAAVKLLAVILFCSLTALAQGAGNLKHFDSGGLTFDYPNGWTLTESSNSDAQQMQLTRSDSDAQISIFVPRGKVDTPERVAQARTKLIDPYLNYTSQKFVEMGATPTRTPASTEIGGAQAEGVHIRAVLAGEAGEAGVYWLVVNNRLVVLTFFGPDQSLKRATPAWDTVRNSLHIQAASAPPAQQTNPH